MKIFRLAPAIMASSSDRMVRAEFQYVYTCRYAPAAVPEKSAGTDALFRRKKQPSTGCAEMSSGSVIAEVLARAELVDQVLVAAVPQPRPHLVFGLEARLNLMG